VLSIVVQLSRALIGGNPRFHSPPLRLPQCISRGQLGFRTTWTATHYWSLTADRPGRGVTRMDVYLRRLKAEGFPMREEDWTIIDNEHYPSGLHLDFALDPG
jgi:hypothetical protein